MPTLRRFIVMMLVLLVLMMGVLVVSAQQQTFTGYQANDVEVDTYEFYLSAGQTINALAEATSGDLDTYLVLRDWNGETVAENDDRDFPNDLNAEITYTASVEGVYTLVVTHILDTSGNYLLTVNLSGGTAPPPPVNGTDGLIVEHEGYMGDDVSDYYHEITLQAGQAVVVFAEATGGDLDTYLLLRDAAGNTVIENDDRDYPNDLNAELAYASATGGTYTIVVSNFAGTSGQYRLTARLISPDEVILYERVRLSGPIQTIDTPNFRIHYTLEGEDATTEAFARKVAETMEEVRMIQVDQMGWAAPPPDNGRGGDDRYDVYLANILDGIEGHDLGYASPEMPYGDNPNNTDSVQQYAAPSYIVLDNAYSEPDVLNGRAPVSLMRATAAHEFHHSIQFGYDMNDSHNWLYEATATWMETTTFPLDQDATGYVEVVLSYPEICFGAADDPSGGLMMYGEWLFIQSLADAYGDEAPLVLWEHIAEAEGWESLELTVAAYGDKLLNALARYRVQNLVRDYEFTSSFAQHTVWLEAVIDGTGNWQYTGEGIQELGANYFELALPSGVYDISLNDSSGYLNIWAVGISGDVASAIPLNRAGTVSTVGYDNVYLIVMNTEYGDDLLGCAYRSYTIDVAASEASPALVAFEMNASQFQPPQ